MKKTLIFSILSFSVFGQRYFTDQFIFNKAYVNPAATGRLGGLSTSIGSVNQLMFQFRPNVVSQFFVIEKALTTKIYHSDSLKAEYLAKSVSLNPDLNDFDENRYYQKKYLNHVGLMGFNSRGGQNPSTMLAINFARKIALDSLASLRIGLMSGFHFMPFTFGLNTSRFNYLPFVGTGIWYQKGSTFVSIGVPILFAKNDLTKIIPRQVVAIDAGTKISLSALQAIPFVHLGFINQKLESALGFRTWASSKWALGMAIVKYNSLGVQVLADYSLADNIRISGMYSPAKIFNSSGLLSNQPFINFNARFVFSQDKNAAIFEY